MTKPSRIIEEMHETVQGLHAGGLIDERRMREFETLYRANQVPKFTADSVKALPFAPECQPGGTGHHHQHQCRHCPRLGSRYKNPGGPSCKLLEMLDRKGLEALL